MALKLEKFNKEQETWQRFVQRVELYFISAGIGDNAANVAKRRAILLQGMGIELYNKFCDSAGGNIANMTFEQIVTAVEALVNPAPLEIYERFRFHGRAQQPDESAADYMVALRKIALSCNFGRDGANNADPTNARLRDQFVCGLRDQKMQQYLLQQAALTIDNCVTLAQSFESAVKTTDLLSRNGVGSKPDSKPSDVNVMKTGSKGSAQAKWKGTCGHCGRKDNHHPKDCRFRKASCFKCGEKGHISPVCPENGQDSGSESDEPETSKSIKRPSGKKKGTVGRIDAADPEIPDSAWGNML